MIKSIKENPLMAVMLALLVAAIGIIGGMNHFSLETIQTNQRISDQRMWEKLDRVTSLMMREATEVKGDLKDVQKMTVCHSSEISEIRERMKMHIAEYERQERGRR